MYSLADFILLFNTYIGTNMSKYITFKVKILTTGQVVEWLAKDSIDAREGVADFYEVDYEQTKLV